MEKILISGTGRCGTTFLIKLFTFCGMDTGFNKDNYKDFIFSNCNSGMENPISSPHHIIKSPLFVFDIENILNEVKIKYMIIPVRNFQDSAMSRVKNGQGRCGGLWESSDLESQVIFYNKITTKYLLFMVKYDIKTIFIDFDRMVTNPKYLYDILNPILDEHNIDFATYLDAYNISSETSKPSEKTE
jgi:hypothetical protein